MLLMLLKTDKIKVLFQSDAAYTVDVCQNVFMGIAMLHG